MRCWFLLHGKVWLLKQFTLFLEKRKLWKASFMMPCQRSQWKCHSAWYYAMPRLCPMALFLNTELLRVIWWWQAWTTSCRFVDVNEFWNKTSNPVLPLSRFCNPWFFFTRASFLVRTMAASGLGRFRFYYQSINCILIPSRHVSVTDQ